MFRLELEEDSFTEKEHSSALSKKELRAEAEEQERSDFVYEDDDQEPSQSSA